MDLFRNVIDQAMPDMQMQTASGGDSATCVLTSLCDFCKNNTSIWDSLLFSGHNEEIFTKKTMGMNYPHWKYWQKVIGKQTITA